jgi:hypothetical protein
MGPFSAREWLTAPRIAVAGAGLAAAVTLYAFDPATTHVYPRCPFLLVTGCYCPGCGALRALHELLRGDVAAAVGYNALLVVAIPALAALVIVPRWSYSPRVARLTLALVLAFGVLRNVPLWPLTLLRP